ncbi:WD40 repeat domain-containing protein [Aspergillus undulatus]|uniref:WD40 repeat domain-containing protein n=1 Tax=Aspergillus undulatus TaxID=1810928 RepID=UPI003CCDC227
MPSKDHSSPARLAKRSRGSDAPSDNLQLKKERTKRRRTTTDVEETLRGNSKSQNALEVSQKPSRYDTTSTSSELALSTIGGDATPSSTSWSMTRGIAGQFTNLDPVLSSDEQYIFLGLETAIYVYSVATSRLFRILEAGRDDTIVGYRLSHVNQERLYIFTLSGSVSEWDWPSNKQLAQWSTSCKTLSADLVYNSSQDGGLNTHGVIFSLQERKDGKRVLAVTPLTAEKSQRTVVLEANTKIDGFKVIENGQAIVAYGSARIFWGSLCSHQDSGSPTYAWKEVKLATSINCIDIKEGCSGRSGNREIPEIDLALGGADGSVLICHDASSFFSVRSGREEDKQPAPRRLHWHRNPVTAVRWSIDGNYVLSGGHESVMVLWQLDTGRKQFLPHLSSPICNIVVSGSGNSYAVKLADNRVVVLSARELRPLATITSLQLCAKPQKAAGQLDAKGTYASRAVAAALHPQHPDQLLVAVPAAHQLTQEGITSTSAPVLQTYDIRTGTHLSRQALARTNATTLDIGPDGTKILTPDIKHLGVSDDGKWMATIDSWSPHPEDVEALNVDSNAHSELEEIYLKFWRWNESSSVWQLVTRIDNPHLSDDRSASILNIAARPNSHEFVTMGSDGLLRLWRPIVKQRHVLKKDDEQVPETWKCRNTLDLRGHLETCNANPTSLKSASVCFSEDGSVLAASLQSTSTNLGLAILIDVRTCSVRYSKVGRSVFIWDSVNDIVTTVDSPGLDSPGLQSNGDGDSRLLAVNSRTQTFAVASKNLQKKVSSKKLRRSGFAVQVYDVSSLAMVSRFKLAKEPVALLSNSQSAEFVVVDAGANVQQIGCASKASQARHTDDLVQYPDFALEGLFGRQRTSKPNELSIPAIEGSSNAQPSTRNGLADVFGDTPPFVLPPSRISIKYLGLVTILEFQKPVSTRLARHLQNVRSVEQGLPVPATTGFLDNSEPSLIISAANGDLYGPSDRGDESESDSIPTSATQSVPPTPIPREKLMVETANSSPGHVRTGSEDNEPKSVIHAPAGFSEFTVEQSSEHSAVSQEGAKPSSGPPISIKVIPGKEGERTATKFSNSPISPPPLTTSIEPAKDWSERATPRAQTRQDLDEFDRRSHSSNLEGESQLFSRADLANINSGVDIPESVDNLKGASGVADQTIYQPGLVHEYFPTGGAEITALQAALVDCWSLCNTLATLSSIHRERSSFTVEIQDEAWKSCWRLCQQLYAGQVDDNASQVNPTLDLCRDFCQTLFDTRARDNKVSDSVLRVSFELNNHLYNTHDRNLPDAFRERTLDFYITLCHRLMKQRTRVPETDSLLSACWSLAEMLFSIRQSKKEGRQLDEELLGSAVQSCWELCDIFREGWTQRSSRNSDRGTPRPSQATFTPAEKQTKQPDMVCAEEALFCSRHPETPTTIFEDVGTVSPEEDPVQNIFLLGQRRNVTSHANWSSNASNISGRTQSSERTSSTNTVITLSNDSNTTALRVLIAKAALNNGFQPDSAQTLSSFVKSLSSDAFGSAPWQRALLKHYKALVAFEPIFQRFGPSIKASAMDIARAIKFMAQSEQYLWLYDLYRLVFGFHVEEGASRDTIMLQT